MQEIWDQHISSSYQHLPTIDQYLQKQMEYEAREKAIRDHNQRMYESRRDGFIEGEMKGRKEGREEGRKEGLKEGEIKGEMKIIQTLLQTMSPEQVANALHKPIDEIVKISETVDSFHAGKEEGTVSGSSGL